MLKDFQELINNVKSKGIKKKIVVAAAHDKHTLEGLDKAYKEGLIDLVLIGNEEKIKELIKEYSLSIPFNIVDAKNNEDSVKKAVNLIKEGSGDALMKGAVTTAELLKEVVNRERGISLGRTMSHFGLFQIPRYHKLIGMTDGGMIPYPSIDEKIDIIKNGVEVMESLGYENPKVACLAASEVVDSKIKESVEAKELSDLKWDNCHVEGPISYDLALDKEMANIKKYKGKIAGDSDILIVPNMASGNFIGKAWSLTAGGKMAGIVVGCQAPIILVSRGATSEEKYLSIVLAAAVS